MLYYIYFTLDFYKSLGYKNKTFKISEPFKGLFTQGMVCHETYRIDNEWKSPDEVESTNGKDFYLKNKPEKK